MELRSLYVALAVVLAAQYCRACVPNCASGANIANIDKTIERVEVVDAEEAQWRGACHSFCISVSLCMPNYEF